MEEELKAEQSLGNVHILQVIPFFTPQMGGSAQVVYQISRHLAARGLEVTVVTSDYGMRETWFPRDSFRVIALPNAIAHWGFYLTPGLVSWAKKNVRRYEVIHMHTIRTFQNAVVSYYAKKHFLPYVLSAHGTLPVIVQRQSAKQAYDLLVGRRLIAGAARLIAVSNVELNQYAEVENCQKKLSLIYNGLDLQEFEDLPPKGCFRQPRGIPDQVNLVLYLGRLHKRKSLDILIKAFERLHRQVRNCILVIAGPDEGEETRLKEQAIHLGLGDLIRFVGPLYGRDKLAALVDANVIASPGVYEIFGLVPFEALMCGTPVVVSNDCGAGQIIQDAKAGYLVPSGDVDALVIALRKGLTNEAETRTQVKSGQEYIQKRLDWRVIAAGLERLYSEVAQ